MALLRVLKGISLYGKFEEFITYGQAVENGEVDLHEEEKKRGRIDGYQSIQGVIEHSPNPTHL